MSHPLETRSTSPIERKANNSVLEALDQVIAELREDTTKQQPTKMEQVAEIFRMKLIEGGAVILDDVVPLFENTNDKRQQARNFIAYVSDKLKEKGFSIQRGYHIVSNNTPITDSTTSDTIHEQTEQESGETNTGLLVHAAIIRNQDATDTDHQYPAPPLFKEDGSLNPEYIEWGFAQILQKQSPHYSRTNGREPVQFRRVYEAFHEHQFGMVSLTDLEAKFIDTKNPHKQVPKAIWAVNRAFEEHEIYLEIESMSSRRSKVTYYRIHE